MNQKNLHLPQRSSKAEEQDRFIDLDRLMAVVTRRIRTILAGVAIFAALAVAYLLTAPSSYTSATQILLDETCPNMRRISRRRPAASRPTRKSPVLSKS